MNKFSFLIILCTFIFTSCEDLKKENQARKKDTEVINVKRNSILGKWGGLGESSPVWDIRNDSIYYYQHSKAFAFRIINKDMHIDFGDHFYILHNIHAEEDTLFFFDSATALVMKGYRFK